MIYNDELTPEQIEEAARILAAEEAERARIQALTDRFKAIKDPHLAISLAGLSCSNPALILKNAIESNDDSQIVALEAQVSIVNARANQEIANNEALKFLSDTDWLIIREIETGVVCPAEIKAQRAAARASIVR